MPLGPETFQALQMFGEGVKELSVARTLMAANERVNEIKATEDSEQNKRSQMQDLSNMLVRQLGAQGVSPMQIAQQAQSVSPQFKTAAEATMQGVLTGNESLKRAGIEADIAGQAGNIEQLRVQQAGQMILQDKKFQQAMALQGAKVRKPSEADVSFDSNVQSALSNLQQLEKTVKKSGNFEMLDPTAEAILSQAQYDLAIAYSKIVDPATAAREGEVKAAQKYMLPMGLGTRNSVTMANIKQFKKKIEERIRARQKAKAGGQMDIYDQHFGGANTPAAGSAPEAETDDVSAFIHN